MVEQKNDEIDLLELFSKASGYIKKWTHKLINFIVQIMFFSIRNIIWFILFLIVGIIVGYSTYQVSDPFYESTTMIKSNYASNNQMLRYINNLHNMIEDKEGLAKALSISSSTAKGILDIEAFWEIDDNYDGIGDRVDFTNSFVPSPKDSIKQRLIDHFIIRVRVTDVSIINDLKNGLHNYIKQNPYFVKIAEMNALMIEEKISVINQQLQKLDSLQKVKYFRKPDYISINKVLIGEEKDSKDNLYHREILELLDDKLALEKKAYLSKDLIEVLEDFTIINKRSNNSTLFMKVSVMRVFILGILIILFWDRRKPILHFIKRARNSA